MSLKDRKGTFRIVKNNDRKNFAEWYDTTQCVLEHCVVVRADYDPLTNQVKYYAISPYFEEVKEGLFVPEYKAELIVDEHGHPEFKRFVIV